ncbi:MAG: hypothetical protein A2447_05700 [Omnitrophica WOR_2 bacterium RIFOXYC2_FULL_38_12]|nr:MAG: hypothetical protein A2447_05700 [Omnitrophica WOR_2 bacterium RIFOXYC2_FULL_38_12]
MGINKTTIWELIRQKALKLGNTLYGNMAPKWKLVAGTAILAGIVIPSGSTLNLNNGVINVGGDVVIEGSLVATTGTVTLSGNWENVTGLYASGTGSVTFTASSGTQTITSGGVTVARDFYNLGHNGSGTVQLISDDIRILGDFENAAGTFDANTQTIAILGDWSHGSSATFVHGSQTVVFEGGNQTIRGSTSAFYNFSKQSPGSTLTFDINGEQVFEGKLTLRGAMGNIMNLVSNSPATMAQITLRPGQVTDSNSGLQDIEWLVVEDSDARGGASGISGLTLVGRNSSSNLSNTENWVFGSAIVTWQGDIDNDWNRAANWDLGIVPSNIDTARIPDVSAVNVQPRFSSNVTIANLTLLDNATVDMNTRDLVVSGQLELDAGAVLEVKDGDLSVLSLDNEGTVQLYGQTTQNIAITAIDPDSGIFEFIGDSDVSEAFILKDFGPVDYFNLVINDNDGGAADTFRTSSDLVVRGTLTVTASTLDLATNNNVLTAGLAGVGGVTVNGGIFTANTGGITADGDLTVSSGSFTSANNSMSVEGDIAVSATGSVNVATTTLDVNGGLSIAGTSSFTAPDGDNIFTLYGDFTHSDTAVFTHSSGTITLDGGDQSILGNANTTFFDLNKSVAVPSTLVFTASSIQMIAAGGNLTLQGTDASNLLYIQSDILGTESFIELRVGATQRLNFLEVRDSNASGTAAGGSGAVNVVTLVARNSDEPNDNNTNWLFGGAIITWEGDISTDWDTLGNWDLGLVPETRDTAIIPDVATVDPTLASIAGAGVEVANIEIRSGGQLTLSTNASEKDLTVTDTLTNDGTIILNGSETLTVNSVETDPALAAGTFIYVGNNTGNTFTVEDLAGSGYYNLTINDTNPTPSTFNTDAVFTVNNQLAVSGGTFNPGANLNISDDVAVSGGMFAVSGDFTVAAVGTVSLSGGALTATAGNLDINGNLEISGGAFTAPGSGQTFTLGRNFTQTAGSFTHSSGEITFDSSEAITINTNNSTFYDFTSVVFGKVITIVAGDTIEIDNEVDLQGTTGLLTTIQSDTPNTRANIIVNQPLQSVQFLNVIDSDIGGPGNIGNNLVCFNCNDGNNNDDLEAAPHWLFRVLSITIPVDSKTTDRTPTVIGVSDAGETVTFRSLVGAVDAVVGSVVVDANGNFRFEIPDASLIDTGVNYVTPYLGVLEGGRINLNVAATPNPAQQPTITSHSDGEKISGGLPIISGQGVAGAAVDILAHDQNGNMLLQTVGSTTVGADLGSGFGNYSVQLSTALLKGINYLSVTVDGVASDITWLVLSDVYGVVFDSVEDTPVNNAIITLYRAADNQPATVADGDLYGTDANPYTTTEDGTYSFLTANADYYINIQSAAYNYPSLQSTFPPGRSIITGSLGEQFTTGLNSGAVLGMDQPMDFNFITIRIEKNANKKEARIGDVITYEIKIENMGENLVEDLYIQDRIPPGFKYIDDRVILDGVPIENPTGKRDLLFSVGDFIAGQTKYLKYQLVVGSGVTLGNYENSAYARYIDVDRYVSNISTESVKIILDPIFDLGTIIGKVFFDQNENGVQDAPEYVHMDRDVITENPIPNVKIVMEDGTVITTDKNGRFSVPAVLPGRHLLRLDERTLPQGSYLTTDKAVIVDITQGMIQKVNFGVNLDHDRFKTEDAKFFTNRVKVSQEKGKPDPLLNVSLFGNEIVTYDGAFVEKAEFKIFTDYTPFIELWRIEVFDADTKRKLQVFTGNRYNIHDPIFWDGRDMKGDHVLFKDRNLEYMLYVENAKGNYDETEPQKLAFRELADKEAYDKYVAEKVSSVSDYRNWINKEREENRLKVRGIYVDGETVFIDRISAKLKSIRIMKDGEVLVDVPVVEIYGLTARDILEGADTSQKDDKLKIILPKGDYEVLVQEDLGEKKKGVNDTGIVKGMLSASSGAYDGLASRAGTSADDGSLVGEIVGSPVKTYSQPIRVGEDYMFFVGLGDAKAGYNFTGGNIEPIAQDDKFNGGFWKEGKMAYYLKGKVLGKYLITSSYDSEREKKALFAGLDKDEYYPVYGDDSMIDRTATDTQGNLYMLIEWDKSSAKWGNYAVNFDDTEFAKFSRSLYGGNVSFESMATNKYGEAKSNAVVFHSKIKEKTAHVEYLATGGSLYYLKHRDIVAESDKVLIEVRDKVTGLVIKSEEMKEGADYEMDYERGRMLFWKPIPMLVKSYSIISDDLFNGNLVYVVADYTYEIVEELNEATFGTRVQQALGENVLVGSTYVKESQNLTDYTLKGADVKVHLGADANASAEYAETTASPGDNYVSTDGGITFTQIALGDAAKGRAYGIKGDAKLFNRLGVTTKYQFVENDFSTNATTAQQGKEIIGIESIYDFNEESRALFRHDIQSLIEDGNVQTQLQLGATKTATTLVQYIHQLRKLKITGEYRRKVVTSRISQFESESNTEENVLAARADYEFSDRLKLSLQQDISIDGEDNDQTTVGVVVKPTDKITLGAEKTFGEKGIGTNLDMQIDTDGRVKFVGNYSVSRDRNGNITNDIDTTSTVGEEDGKNLLKIAADDSSSNAVGSLGAIIDINDKLQVETTLGATDILGENMATTLAFGGKSKINETTSLDSSVSVANSKKETATTVSVGGTSQLDPDTSVESKLSLTGSDEGASSALIFGGKSRVDEKTTTETQVSVDEATDGGRTATYTFGTKKKLSDEFELASTKTFGETAEESFTQSGYSLIREKDGKALTGSLSRKYSETDVGDVSRTNIFGLTGDIDDRWAVEGSYQKGDVLNHDGTSTKRDVFTLGVGYAKKDEETGDTLTSSTKLELRRDQGENGGEDKRQYLAYNATEGYVTPALKLMTKIEVSATENLSTDTKEAQHREVMIGFGYRPVLNDRLNLLGRYTYLESQGPAEQEDTALVEQERAHVLSGEAVYDISEHWQFAEKLAIRVAEEKVAGFDFTKTRTWLMIHRLNYKIDRDWSIGGEFRTLSVVEAKDIKRGVLIEASRNLGDFSQLGLGYNFTTFSDDLTDLDYSSQGPFVRMTGKLYDRTPEERERARQRWLDEKIRGWAWVMVNEELSKENSPVLQELNEHFIMAQEVYDRGEVEEARKIYKDIVIAGQMMFEEASEYIRGAISKEEKLKEMKVLADQYFKNGQYEKAKKILEKILEETNKPMLE